MTLQFGVFVPQGWKMDLAELSDPVEQYEAMARVALAVDALAAYDSIWLYDHFHPIPVPVQQSVFECWISTAALARETRRVKVGQMVTCNGYRHPALLAKMASTVDVLSHGRLYCGLGAGWYEHEWRAYGYGFPETRQRMAAFVEACEIVVRMWTEEAPRFQGKYYAIDAPINMPKGVQKPHPALWIGGGGERVTLKLVARWGDACNISADPETLRHKFAVLREHCEQLGRDYDRIIRSTSMEPVLLLKPGEAPDSASRGGVQGTPEQVAEQMQRWVDVGVNYFLLYFPRIAYDQEVLHRFAEEVMPRLRPAL
jgi:F420-dependent oxidoreductase-like protein